LSSTIITVFDIPRPSDSPSARNDIAWDRRQHAPAFMQD
jgi:hypothetical protein